MCANVILRLCANDLHFCAQMKNVCKRNFRKMCANVIAPIYTVTTNGDKAEQKEFAKCENSCSIKTDFKNSN